MCQVVRTLPGLVPKLSPLVVSLRKEAANIWVAAGVQKPHPREGGLVPGESAMPFSVPGCLPGSPAPGRGGETSGEAPTASTSQTPASRGGAGGAGGASLSLPGPVGTDSSCQVDSQKSHFCGLSGGLAAWGPAEPPCPSRCGPAARRPSCHAPPRLCGCRPGHTEPGPGRGRRHAPSFLGCKDREPTLALRLAAERQDGESGGWGRGVRVSPEAEPRRGDQFARREPGADVLLQESA